MRERPILFSAPMVRAILAGAKTQTRRIVKMKTHYQIEERDNGTPWPWMYDGDRDADSWMACPYGVRGTRLWVRETFCDDWHMDRGVIEYRADGELDSDMFDAGCTWRPSIHMPRWASRITLEVTDVRVERLQDISEKDAQAEGIERTEDFFGCPCWRVYGEPDGADVVAPDDPIGSYRSLWESINGPGSWEANPWVWVVSFRRLDAKEGTP